MVTLAERLSLDASPLVSFLVGTERYYYGVGIGIPQFTVALLT